MAFKGRRDAREKGRLGGRALAAKRRAARAPLEPYGGTFADFQELVGMDGPSWAAWRALWAAVDCQPMSEADLATFARHTGRQGAPQHPPRELWVVCGRRAGKSRNLAARAVWTAIRRDWRSELARGETAVIPCIAADKPQASITLSYVKAMFDLPELRPYVGRRLRDSVETRLGSVIRVATCSYKSVRGFTSPLVVGDECSFWQTADGAASPDAEVLGALRPTMATVPGALMLVASTPYARAGALWKAYEAHYGRDDSGRVLVWNGSTRAMNPEADAGEIAAAFDSDALAAASEYGEGDHVQFRSDVEAFISREVVESATVSGRHELSRREGVMRYCGFVDPAGGSGGDSYTLAVAHQEGEVAVLDCVRELRPPFNPETATRELAGVLLSYGLREVTGDAYSGQWVRDAFQRYGITYRVSERVKSAIYLDVLPLLNAGAAELLDIKRLAAQLLALERRTARSGRDSIDHPGGGRDDVANAACGALVLAASRGAARLPELSPGALFGGGELQKESGLMTGYHPLSEITQFLPDLGEYWRRKGR